MDEMFARLAETVEMLRRMGAMPNEIQSAVEFAIEDLDEAVLCGETDYHLPVAFQSFIVCRAA